MRTELKSDIGLAHRLHLDLWLLGAVAAICGLGLVVLHSAGGEDPQLLVRQGIRIVVGLATMILIAQVPPKRLAGWSLWLYLAGVVLLVLVIFFGVGKGAQRWLDFGVVRFQPSEIMKIAVPLIIAWYLGDKPLPPNLPRILLTGVAIALPVFLVARQPDLGTALLIGVSGVIALFLAGISRRYIVSAGLAMFVSLPLVWYSMHDYQQRRIMTLIDPESDPLGSGYHIIQSKIAIGSGGIYGKGWLNGTQSRLEFLPERSTDFIFAVYCEEFGFVGVLALLAAYLFVIFRALYIASQAQDMFGRLVSGSLALIFFVYIFVNMGMVIGHLPVVGIPLPLISSGGTSLVTLMAGFGILMSVHTHRRLMLNP